MAKEFIPNDDDMRDIGREVFALVRQRVSEKYPGVSAREHLVRVIMAVELIHQATSKTGFEFGITVGGGKDKKDAERNAAFNKKQWSVKS